MRKYPNFNKITKELIYRDLRDNGGEDTAALAGGISVRTLKKWIEFGEKAEEEFEEKGSLPEDSLAKEYYEFLMEYRAAQYEGLKILRDATNSLLSVSEGQKPELSLLKDMLERKRVYPEAIRLEEDLSRKNRGGRILGVIFAEQPALPAPSMNPDVIDVEVRRVED